MDFILSHKNIGAEALHTSGGILFRSPYTYPVADESGRPAPAARRPARRGLTATRVPSTAAPMRRPSSAGPTNCGIPASPPSCGYGGACRIRVDWLSRRPNTRRGEERELTAALERPRAVGKAFPLAQFEHPQLGRSGARRLEPEVRGQNPPHKFRAGVPQDDPVPAGACSIAAGGHRDQRRAAGQGRLRYQYWRPTTASCPPISATRAEIKACAKTR